MGVPGWTGSCNTGIRLTSAELPSLLHFESKQTISITQLNKSCHLAYHTHIYLIYSFPIDTYPVLFEDFFHTYLEKKRSPERTFSKWRFFKTLASRLRVHGRERRFFNTMMSYIIYTTSITLSLWAMLYRISIVLAFASEDGRKRLEYATCGRVFFKNIRICVDVRGLILTYLQ